MANLPMRRFYFTLLIACSVSVLFLP